MVDTASPMPGDEFSSILVLISMYGLTVGLGPDTLSLGICCNLDAGHGVRQSPAALSWLGTTRRR